MARRQKTIVDIRKRLSLDNIEVIAAVCKEFCAGRSPSQISDALGLRREQPYEMLKYAVDQGWIKFSPPLEHSLAEKLRDRRDLLEGVDVVHTSVPEDVAYRGAKMLVELVRQVAGEKGKRRGKKTAVHIGLAAGGTIRQVAKSLADLLREQPAGLPSELVFHAIVTGMQLRDPTTDPSSFFIYLSDPRLPVKIRFVSLHGPAMPDEQLIEELKNRSFGIKDAFDEKDKIDIIVTSGSSWKDEKHSMLKALMEKHDETGLQTLLDEGCVADMCWRPLRDDRPSETKTKHRALTLYDLSDFAKLIKKDGKRVLLVLGPCVRDGCGKPKGDVLKTIMSIQPPLISHLVVDTRTARQALDELNRLAVA